MYKREVELGSERNKHVAICNKAYIPMYQVSTQVSKAGILAMNEPATITAAELT